MKKPRFGKSGFIYHIFTRKNFYKEFKEAYPEYSDKSWNEIRDTWDDISKEFRHQIAKNPLGIKLKYYIGELKFQYLPYKMKTMLKVSEEESQRTINLHNRGKTGILKWERRFAVRYNKWLQYFAFDACDLLKKEANNTVLEDPDSIRTSRITTGRKYK